MVKLSFTIEVSIDYYGTRRSAEKYKDEVIDWYTSFHKYGYRFNVTNFTISFLSGNEFKIEYDTTETTDNIVKEINTIINPVEDLCEDEEDDGDIWPWLTLDDGDNCLLVAKLIKNTISQT